MEAGKVYSVIQNSVLSHICKISKCLKIARCQHVNKDCMQSCKYVYQTGSAFFLKLIGGV